MRRSQSGTKSTGRRRQRLDPRPAFKAATPAVLANLQRVLALSENLSEGAMHRMLDELKRISIIGADPDWQIAELEEIVERVGGQAVVGGPTSRARRPAASPPTAGVD